MKRKIALIFGITGQDGAYLAEFLLKKITLCMELKDVPRLSILAELITYIKIHMKEIENSFYIMEM